MENNGKPVWKHFHENINVYLFNSNLGFWKIGLEYTQTFSLIENRLIGKELIPQKKWRYWNNTRFIDDDLLTVTAVTNNYPKELSIIGGDDSKTSDILGDYILSNEVVKNGKPIWKHKNKEKYLHSKGSQWIVRNDPDVEDDGKNKVVYGWDYSNEDVTWPVTKILHALGKIFNGNKPKMAYSHDLPKMAVMDYHGLSGMDWLAWTGQHGLASMDWLTWTGWHALAGMDY